MIRRVPPPCRAALLPGLVVLGLLSGCSGSADPEVAASDPSSATPTVSPLPSLAGPRSATAFDVIKAYGVRPGSPDDFLIRDLLTVADAQRAHLAVHGSVGSLEEVQRASGYRLRGSKVALVSGLGSADRFCLRAYQSDESPRQWFFDTDQVLPPGDSC